MGVSFPSSERKAKKKQAHQPIVFRKITHMCIVHLQSSVHLRSVCFAIRFLYPLIALSKAIRGST